MYNFALIGAGGYIAPRHMKAIKDTGNRLVAALDPNDSVGIIDSFFPEADFFLQPERFDRHLDKLRRQGEKKIDFVSICSPNFLHDSHIRLALRNQANAICEKPIVLNPWNIDALEDIENETGFRIYNILQLRLHPQIIALKEKIKNGPTDKIYDLDLTYITSRGKWYHYSWKGDVEKSGGLATNIGVHFFDMLGFIFGKIRLVAVHHSSPTVVAGFLQYDKARVRWFLSIDSKYLPKEIAAKGQRTYRSILIDGEEFEFSEGFADLHTRVYEDILSGGGYGLEDARQSVEIVYQIRNAKPFGLTGDFHPYLLKVD
ncbi:MAG TPA: Gfo/Idh/MocA family oxidoreductase [Bacteroidales bacterium]|nr:Gfo/Idh/MocA family oxidoreductase [Bacteroidales bacterium]MBP9511695.1 Gfo/Idh/MocA family oxidoreductase [Bacteroidales bacterium]MBP9588014.1 Gfo/Idh/MocA family oxidoreductase [Bacteroidales bacterium]NMD15307.1 Gfo/Idh/MocA family oxidoreductase [Bacteroidales bacterium]HNQ60003.1 Gfo/Idh/MocA family oxidoreductase [Bacteroidales bacterium]